MTARLKRLCTGVALLLYVGCADEDPSLPCNIAERACQRVVFRATAEVRGQTGAKLPAVRVISRDQLEAELRAAFEFQSDTRDETQIRRDEQGQRALSLFGLLPPPSEQSADDAYIEQSVATIAAYYSHGSKDITIIADQTRDAGDATVTLAHEFVHSLQDQRDGLSGLRERYVETTDDDVALTSLVEGEATWLSYATFFQAVDGRAPDEINHPRLFFEILRNTLSDIDESSAPLIDAAELLPYPVGGARVAQLHVEEGPASIEALFDQPPLALRWWTLDAPAGLPFDLECDLPPAPEGYERFDEDRLGFGGLLAYHAAQGDNGMLAFNAAQSWRADQLATYGALDDSQRVAVAWRLTLASEIDATNLARLAVASGVAGSVQGRSVLLTAASDAALLDAWKPSEGCPAFPKSRAKTPGILARLKRRLKLTR
ncbi:MAG TPA: hypothetical protein VFZ61_24250 [Polyangiales bacterium]